MFLIILFSGCAKSQPKELNHASLSPEATASPPNTPSPDRVVLAISETDNATTVTDAENLLSELAAESNLEFETRQKIYTNEITPDVKIMVFLSNPENLGVLANVAPYTQFVVLSDRDWHPSANINIIRIKPEHQSFLAGYITTMIPANFRGGGLLATEDTLLNQAFENGGHYYCGLCQALVFPLNQYPATAIISGDSPASSWQAAFEELNLDIIQALYVAPESYSPELFNYLANYDIALIGIDPPIDEARSHWAVTILTDGISPILSIWNDLLEGKGGKTINASLKLTDIQSAYLTEGKLKLVQKVIDSLQAGEIYTLDIPLE